MFRISLFSSEYCPYKSNYRDVRGDDDAILAVKRLARLGRGTAVFGLLLLAACSTPPHQGSGSTTAAAPSGSATVPAGATAPTGSTAPTSAGNRAAAPSNPSRPAATSTGSAIPNGTTTVSHESQDERDNISVSASRLNGIWVMHLPRQVDVSNTDGFRVLDTGEYIDVFCGVHHQGQQLGMACPMMWRFDQSAQAEDDGDRVRFEWRRAGYPTIVIEGRFTSPTEITGEEMVQLRGIGAVHPAAPARLRKIMAPAAPSAQSAKAEALLRGAIDDMRRGAVTSGRYAPEVADQMTSTPPLTTQDLVSLGAIDEIRYLGATAVVKAAWVRNPTIQHPAPEVPDNLSDKPVYVFDVRFAEDSRLCRVDVSPEGLASRLDCR